MVAVEQGKTAVYLPTTATMNQGEDMSAPLKAEILEEFAGEIDAKPQDVFDVWFQNNASETLVVRLHELYERSLLGTVTHKDDDDTVLEPYANTQALVLDLLSDVVDVWLDAYKAPSSPEERVGPSHDELLGDEDEHS